MKYQTFNVIQAEKSWGYTKSDTYMYTTVLRQVARKKKCKSAHSSLTLGFQGKLRLCHSKDTVG